MAMTVKQTKSFIRLALSDILDVIGELPDGDEKTKLQSAADLLRETVDD
ncbi:MAG: hypothetical protein NC299_02195 [Lachnospiraceae bacterium]|nr:hypothetical protein [Ruminococcus sp.]MCM1274159.1 hypothetical protein [Lachnospiraceae bacterium]